MEGGKSVVMDPEDKLDEEIEGSFPASDPPSNTVVIGVGGGKHEEAPLGAPGILAGLLT